MPGDTEWFAGIANNFAVAVKAPFKSVRQRERFAE